MKNSSKRSLEIAANLFLFQGVFGCVAMIISLLNGKIDIRLDIVCLFLGYGLLIRSESWRRRALAFTIFEIIIFPVLMILVFFVPHTVLFFQKNEPSSPLSLLLGIMWYAMAWWQYKVLSDPTTQEICNGVDA